MKKLALICVLAVGVYFAMLTYFVEHENMLKEFLAAAAGLTVVLLMLASFVRGLVSYKTKKVFAFVPCIICLLGLPTGFIGAIVLGESIKAANFQKNLPRYTELVKLIENGEIKRGSNGQILLPEQFANLADSTFIDTNRDGRIITFLTDGAFPVWHAGYIYTSSGIADAKFIKGWNCYERVNTNWFYVSN
ncbi:MAG: hypothetical protein RL616_1402 [Verrucomicrobiota bacterium]|jgi:hypothetical protein